MTRRRSSYLRGSLKLLLVWPCLALLLGAVAWLIMSSMLADERKLLRAGAQRDAIGLSTRYALELERTISHVDQIALGFKYQWERAGTAIGLASQVSTGVYPPDGGLYVLLLDRNGRVLHTTLDKANAIDLSDRAYFKAQKAGAAEGLLISGPLLGRVTGNNAVVFSRRVNAPDGSFAGLVAVSVRTDYLAPLLDEHALRAGDFLVARDDAGDVYMQRQAGRPLLPERYRHAGALPGAGGYRFDAGAGQEDTPRFMAWARAGKYPITAIAGLSETSAMAPWHALRARLADIGLGIAALLVVFAAAGIMHRAHHVEAFAGCIHRHPVGALDFLGLLLAPQEASSNGHAGNGKHDQQRGNAQADVGKAGTQRVPGRQYRVFRQAGDGGDRVLAGTRPRH
ncbi:MAG: hypothetical protein EOO78_24405, partial [Oxalobacteraceae bacterium]